MIFFLAVFCLAFREILFFFFFLFRGAVSVVRTQREAAQVRPRRMNLIVVAMNRTWQSNLSTRLLHVPPLFSLHFPFRITHTSNFAGLRNGNRKNLRAFLRYSTKSVTYRREKGRATDKRV